MSKLLILNGPHVGPHFAAVVRRLGVAVARARPPKGMPDETPEGLLLLPAQRMFMTAACWTPEIGSRGAGRLAQMFGWDGLLVVADLSGSQPLRLDAVLEQSGRIEWHTGLRLWHGENGELQLLSSGRNRPSLFVGKSGLVPTFSHLIRPSAERNAGLRRGAELFWDEVDHTCTEKAYSAGSADQCAATSN